jgi:hypothetical protein
VKTFPCDVYGSGLVHVVFSPGSRRVTDSLGSASFDRMSARDRQDGWPCAPFFSWCCPPRQWLFLAVPSVSCPASASSGRTLSGVVRYWQATAGALSRSPVGRQQRIVLPTAAALSLTIRFPARPDYPAWDRSKPGMLWRVHKARRALMGEHSLPGRGAGLRF